MNLSYELSSSYIAQEMVWKIQYNLSFILVVPQHFLALRTNYAS